MISCYLALGANLGAPRATFVKAIELFHSEVGQVAAISSFYETAPLNPPGTELTQPTFLNAVVEIKTSLSPHALFEANLSIERKLGLDRSDKEYWGPRIIDIDILSYADLILKLNDLIIPHPRLVQRDFVLLPLLEIAPRWRHPISGSSAKSLLNNLLRSEAELFVRDRVVSRAEIENWNENGEWINPARIIFERKRKNDCSSCVSGKAFS